MVLYCDYPVVELVNWSSPAKRVGLITGDSVLAYFGNDVQKWPVIYDEIFVAGQMVQSRVRA